MVMGPGITVPVSSRPASSDIGRECAVICVVKLVFIVALVVGLGVGLSVHAHSSTYAES